MSNLSLKVDVIAGTHIIKACEDIVKLSNKLGIMITADFNGHYIICPAGYTKEILIREWEDRQRD